MRILINAGRDDVRAWLRSLASALTKEGHEVGFGIQDVGVSATATTSLVFALQSRIFAPDATLYTKIEAGELSALSKSPDVVIDISGKSEDSENTLRLYLDNNPGIANLVPALIAGHVPFVSFRRQDGSVAAEGLPAVEHPDVLPRAMETFLPRLITLARLAVGNRGQALQHHPAERPSGSGNAVAFFARGVTSRFVNKLTNWGRLADHWRIGIRRTDTPPSANADNGVQGFYWLEDDAARYYADPILWEEGGRTFLFVEEFSYSTHRGIISYTEIGDDGRPLFSPRPIIERNRHLSYPFLFTHEGAIYMAPENAVENHVPLYRARRFPDLWEEVSPLLPDIGLHDATIFNLHGRWWLLGNYTPDGGSSWDCLAVFHADSPFGPFMPHSQNPVVVDSRYARSAGPVFMHEGRLIRPVQNCLGGYGRFLRFMEIDRLDLYGFSQHQIGRVAAPMADRIRGVHTYARSVNFEAIDILTPRQWSPDSIA